MEGDALEALEVDLVLQALQRRHGFAFEGYARASLTRRLRRHVTRLGLERLAELVPLVCHDAAAAHALVCALTVNVTDLFRDPPFYRALRDRVLPRLASFPFLRIWHAGCATGEEVYSLAILLREAGLGDRCQIYATDLNADVVETARRGRYAASRLAVWRDRYRLAGGVGALTDHAAVVNDELVLDPALTAGAVFDTHNLATDAGLGEMQLVLCRNVLIYFGRPLADRVLHVLTHSVARGGVLCLGPTETLALTAVERHYTPLDGHLRIYRKLADALGTG